MLLLLWALLLLGIRRSTTRINTRIGGRRSLGPHALKVLLKNADLQRWIVLILR